VWKISAVSIAAQIATFPLGLLYFHQFPNYFLLSNLVVVPLSFVVLVLGLMVLAASFAAPVAAVLGFCLEWVIRFLNGAVFIMEDMPFSLTRDVYIDAWQCALLMMATFFLLALFEYRKLSYLVLACAALALFAGMQWVHFFRDVDVSRMAVYRVPGRSAVDLIERGKTFFLADSSLRADAGSMRYHVAPYRLIAGVRHERHTVIARVFKGGELIVWNGQRILRVSEQNADLPPSMTVDWIIIGNNAVELAALAERVKCRTIVLDSSNSFFYASRFLEAAKLYKLDVYSVLHEGAFITNFEKKDT
jgi:competence protein ComEC